MTPNKAVQARAGAPFCGMLDALGPPCLTANIGWISTVPHSEVMPWRWGYGLLASALAFLIICLPRTRA
jgi:hypothetical protein